MSTAHAEDVVDSLCAKLLAGKREQERDVAAIGLKTMVTDLPGGPLAALVVQHLCPKLVAGVQSKARAARPPLRLERPARPRRRCGAAPQASYDVVSASLDLLCEVVGRFGDLVSAEHARIRDCLLPELDESRAGVRKRAIHCLSARPARTRAPPALVPRPPPEPECAHAQARWRRTCRPSCWTAWSCTCCSAWRRRATGRRPRAHTCSRWRPSGARAAPAPGPFPAARPNRVPLRGGPSAACARRGRRG